MHRETHPKPSRLERRILLKPQISDNILKQTQFFYNIIIITHSHNITVMMVFLPLLSHLLETKFFHLVN